MSEVVANAKFKDYVYHSLLYYTLDEPTISDSQYDLLCKELRSQWDEVTHPDKTLADESALEAGTGFQMVNRWPAWAVQRAADAGIEHWFIDSYFRNR